MMNATNSAKLLLLFLTIPLLTMGQVKDDPFSQAESVKYNLAPELNGAKLIKVEIDYNNIVYLLTDKGLYRDFNQTTISRDHLYRKLDQMNPVDITTQAETGYLYYLYADRFLTNAHAGTIFAKIPEDKYEAIRVNASGIVLLAGKKDIALYDNSVKIKDVALPDVPVLKWYVFDNNFFALSASKILRLDQDRWLTIFSGDQLTSLSWSEQGMVIGTKEGYLLADQKSGKLILPLQKDLPVSEIVDILFVNHQLWFSTPDGACQKEQDHYRYYAGKRWLDQNQIRDIKSDKDGNIYLLTPTGLNKIGFTRMTLADKAKKMEEEIRKYHLRYGFVCELSYGKPGDLTTAVATDNDNDGLWTTLYLGSQAFKYAVTADASAKRYAWESFETFERLLSVNPLKGFPSRTFERKGIITDTIVWRPSPNPEWDWKGTTSTDEYIGYLFVAAVMDQFIVKNGEERKRVANFIDAIMTHIIDNNYYFIDVDGKPTKWGRWNPEYVNGYAPYVSDRKLNSAHLIAGLELAYSLTGKERYKSEAFKMMNQYGYLDNIMIPMSTIQRTTDFVHQNEVMGDTWNHSDDEMSFFTYWVLHRYAFNETLKKKFAWVAKDHWQVEKPERDGLWNLLTYGISGAIDLESTIWYLREYVTDLDRYSTKNSHRKDLERIPDNFREQTTKTLLPSGERAMIRHNSNPFALDSNDGGHTRLAGDEYLLPYWMARYLKVIQ